MRALLAIPARLTPLIFDGLVTLYGLKAESIYYAVDNDASDERLESLRTSRAELLEIDELLEQLDFSPARRDVEIAGERDVLAAAVYDALTDTIDLLGEHCQDYWNGRADLAEIGATNKTLRGLLRLLRTIEIEATAAAPGSAARPSGRRDGD
jgi:hypothetical protein